MPEGKGKRKPWRRKKEGCVWEGEREQIFLHYNFPRAFTSSHFTSVGFTKRTFTGGVEKKFQILDSHVKISQRVPFYVVKG